MLETDGTAAIASCVEIYIYVEPYHEENPEIHQDTSLALEGIRPFGPTAENAQTPAESRINGHDILSFRSVSRCTILFR